MLGLQGGSPHATVAEAAQIVGHLCQHAFPVVLGGSAAVTIVTAQHLEVVVQIANGSSPVLE